MKIMPPSLGSMGEIPSEPPNSEVSRQDASRDVIESAQSEPNTFVKLIESVSEGHPQSTVQDAQTNQEVASEETATEANAEWKDFSDVAERVATGVAIDTGLVVGAFTAGAGVAPAAGVVGALTTGAAVAPALGAVGAFTFGLPLAPTLGAATLVSFSDVSNAIADGANAVADAVSDAPGAVVDMISDIFGW